MNLHARLAELGLELSPLPAPVAAYVPAVRTGTLLMVSGQLPLVEGRLLAKGRVASDVALERAQVCARQCLLNGLSIVEHELGGDWARLERIVRLGVFVASDPDFTDQHLVANGASELLVDLLGAAGRHARAAVGAASLPLNAPVELELTLELAGK